MFKQLKKIKFTWLVSSLVILSTTSINAVADGGGDAAGKASSVGQMIMMAGLFGIMYFVMIRPQSKRAKEHRQLLAGLLKGDEVITTGGILGKINKVAEQFIVLTIADGVEVAVQKNAIAQVVPKNTIKSI